MWAAGTMQCCQRRITFRTDFYRQTLLVVLVVLGSIVSGNNVTKSQKCSFGLNTPGYTVPEGDILIEFGNPLEIYCKLFEDKAAGRNASDLFFMKNSQLVSPDYTTVVNKTTLRLYIPKPELSSSMYSCKLRQPSEGNEKSTSEEGEAVCLNQVYVGTPPKDVENFTCVSQNWADLKCEWDVPDNDVPTRYQLYSALGAGSRRRKCPTDTDVKKNYCFWSTGTTPHYRPVQKNYSFIMHAVNAFGTENFEHTIFHWAFIIPAPPEDLNVAETTSYSVLLTWSVAYPMDNFTPGLAVKIEYRSEHDSNNTWDLAETSQMIVSKKAQFNLTGLKYANTFYEVRVYMKPSVAEDDDHWSLPATKIIRTKPTVPSAPPKTDIGSFQISKESSKDVYVYWQYIDKLMKNGDKFGYKVIDIKENGVAKQLPHEIFDAYAKFTGLGDGNYSFTVVSSNAIGRSVGSSTVYVPSKNEIVPEPISFSKIAFDNRTFELLWKPPANTSGIKYYTLFWCENGQDRPYQCNGFLDWKHVPKTVNVTSVRVPKDGIYQFAIAANSETASSGMVWASCTVIHNGVVNKMKSFWYTNTSATFVELAWNLDCSESMGTIKGFRVYYCPSLSPDKDECKGEEKSVEVEDSPGVPGKNFNYVLRNLKPYTIYLVSIAVVSKLAEGPRSEYLHVTTIESAPDPVQKLIVTKVTNTSVSLLWTPPAITNGVIKYYALTYNGLAKEVNKALNETTLTDLIPFVNYTIGIAACTVNCSKVTSVSARTNIGNPGEIEAPKVSITNTSLAKVNWDPPLQPGGLLDMYTVRFMSEHDSSSPVYENTSRTELQVQINCANEGWGQKYLFSVQALNRDGEMLYAGPWSENGEVNCVSSEMSGALIVFISLCGIMAMVAGCFGAFYAARRVWGHYNEMRHVKVTLPPGLTSVNVYCPTSYSY